MLTVVGNARIWRDKYFSPLSSLPDLRLTHALLLQSSLRKVRTQWCCQWNKKDRAGTQARPYAQEP